MNIEIKREKVIGILGGMGPYATVDLFKKILDLTPAKKDWEHLRIIIDNNPKIPSRGRYFAYGETNPSKEMILTAQNLELAGADLIVIGCLTAHNFYQEVQNNVKVPIINAVEETVKEIKRNNPDFKKIGLLSTEVTAESGLFQNEFIKQGLEIVVPDNEGLKEVRAIIEALKLNNIVESDNIKLSGIIKSLVNLGAEGIILGCSELPLMIKGDSYVIYNTNNNLDGNTESKIPVFDAMEILVKEVIRRAKED